MAVIVDLSDELVSRLRAEAARRGVTVDAVIADFAARLPSGEVAPKHRLSFIGPGASGRSEPMDLRRERAEPDLTDEEAEQLAVEEVRAARRERCRS